ncbi:trypsin-like peptidase domain-containing protein [Catenulispora rubra]|uniref:trypsin-like peptidase domain-containing protein n=1 Tax=Catenulispora rubra TaxID=280293 RepID=UPI0018927AC4|nr:trypsin-like peptidase domain-containing protein [Catenulispora rubra]
MIPIAARVVEVLAGSDEVDTGPWVSGSGFLIGKRLVLTAGHVVEHGAPRVRRTTPGFPPSKQVWTARVVMLADPAVADLALLEVEGDLGDIPPIGFAQVDRELGRAGLVESFAVGFPDYKTLSTGTNVVVRESVQVNGVIPTAEDLYSRLLTLRFANAPTAEAAPGRSSWSGMSGAAVLADGYVLGVVSTHDPRHGQSQLTVTPMSRIAHLADAERWWRALGVDRAWLPVLPKPEAQCVGALPPVEDHHPRLGCGLDMMAAIQACGRVVLTSHQEGVGGTGKTHLASHYARSLWSGEDVDLVVWVSADRRDKILRIYQEAAAAIGVDSFPHWLATTHRRWLVVLDDVVNTGDLEALWPPDRPNGRVLITVRDGVVAPPAGQDHRVVEVGLFSPDEAAAYIRSCTGCTVQEAEALATDLAFHPLALAQAVAFMRRAKLDCHAYSQRFLRRDRQLPRLMRGTGARGDLQKSKVAVAWSLSVETPDVRAASHIRYQRTTTRDGTQTETVEADDAQSMERALKQILRGGGGMDD